MSNVSAGTIPAWLASTTAASLLRPGNRVPHLCGVRDAKRDRARIDFEDILLCAAALMSERPEIAETIRRTYRHLVVDEYQDVSPLQEALLNLWRGERAELCVVGDPAQTIHSFAGAQASYLTGFGQRFPNATVIRLVRDYRSTPQVVRCANSIMAATASEEPNETASSPSPFRLSNPPDQRCVSSSRRTSRLRPPESVTGWPNRPGRRGLS